MRVLIAVVLLTGALANAGVQRTVQKRGLLGVEHHDHGSAPLQLDHASVHSGGPDSHHFDHSALASLPSHSGHLEASGHGVEGHGVAAVGVAGNHYTHNHKVSHSVSYNRVTIPVAQPVPVRVEKVVKVPYKVDVPYAVDRPYEVRVAKPYPVEVVKNIPVPVDKPYPVHVPVPVQVPVYHKVAVPVPVDVPVAVHKTYPVYIHKYHHIPKPVILRIHVTKKHGGWWW